jgi:HD-GYP domain-containing protein (c-di-GMP phosphodiesterase class II)
VIDNIRIKLSELILAFSKVLDFVNPKVANHHLRVALIASAIAQELGLSRAEVNDIFLASTIHDIGVFSAKEKVEALEFEMTDPYIHAERGFRLVGGYDLFSGISRLIRFHHVPWAEGAGCASMNEDIPIGGHIIHLADRVEVLIDRQKEILGQGHRITGAIKSRSDKIFIPELVEVFESLAVKEFFWFDLASPEIEQIIRDRDFLPVVDLDMNGLLNVTRFFSHIIDYRSSFTSVHSAGVSSVAVMLAQMTGFSETECRLMKVAGNLHDLGKLAVPSEILEKPAKLSPEEFNIMKSHAYHSYRVLEPVAGFEVINRWGSFHHERIDGSGYPFHIAGNELPIGSRILAVADVFTAITEDRPYRKGMSGEEALKVIENMARGNSLDQGVVSVANTYFKHLNDVRINAQLAARKEYLSVKQHIG